MTQHLTAAYLARLAAGVLDEDLDGVAVRIGGVYHRLYVTHVGDGVIESSLYGEGEGDEPIEARTFRIVEGRLTAPEHDVQVIARALREAADDMDDTDDPDAIHVDNGDIDKWLRARADRIEREAGESDADA